MATLTALLQALTAALRAFPIWLAWRVNAEVEDLTAQIITHEAANTPRDMRLADSLRLKLAYRRRLHDALLPAHPPPESGNADPNAGRLVPRAK